MADKITADDIRKALSERYCEPDWYLGFEVGDGCGSEVTRHADAIAICPYPSRGYEALGFEIKVSKQDLKREIEQPAKAEALAKYCNYWFLVVPKGLTDDIQIPEPWGIIEYIDGKLRQKKKAVFSKKAIDIGFCCAFVRSTRRADTAKDIMREREREKIIRENIDMKIRNDLWDYEKLKERLENIKKRTGIDLTNKWYLDEYDIKAMALAKRLQRCHDDFSKSSHLAYLTRDLKEVCEWITSTLKELEKFSELMNGGEKK